MIIILAISEISFVIAEILGSEDSRMGKISF